MKVLLQYHYGKREPITLSMPWQKEPLTWEHIGDAIEVDSDDAERLATTSYQSFRIVERPLIPEKAPDVGSTSPGVLKCQTCGKIYKQQYHLDKHIEAKHGNDNG